MDLIEPLGFFLGAIVAGRMCEPSRIPRRPATQLRSRSEAVGAGAGQLRIGDRLAPGVPASDIVASSTLTRSVIAASFPSSCLYELLICFPRLLHIVLRNLKLTMGISRKHFTRTPRRVYALYGRHDLSIPHPRRKEAHLV